MSANQAELEGTGRNNSATSGRRLGLVAVLYVGLAALATSLSGAPQCGFGSYDDEPSHLASALMIRDWIAAGFPVDVRAFAERYYVHYPKVALGQWPPMLPCALGAWILVCGTKAWSILAFFIALAAGVSTCVYALLRRMTGEPLAIAAGVVLLLTPIFQEFTHVSMTEMPLAFLCTVAALSFGQYLDRDRSRYCVLFGLTSLSAILVKGSAFALALVPPLAIAMTGQWRYLARPVPWLAAALVALGALPWYVLTLRISLTTWAAGTTPHVEYFQRGLVYYGLGLGGVAGWIVAALVPVGAYVGLKDPIHRGRVAALSAWLIGALLCYSLLPTGLELRHLATIAPAWLALAALGAHTVVARAPRLARRASPIAALLLLLGFAPWFRVVHKDRHGAVDAAAACLANARLTDTAVLIASDPKGEGTLVTSIALGEARRPGFVVLRASKVLGTSDWMGRDYEPSFTTQSSLSEWLDALPVAAIVFDMSTPGMVWYPHHDLLRGYLVDHADEWDRVGEYDAVRFGARFPGAVALYVRHAGDLRRRRELTFGEVSGRRLNHSKAH